MTANASLRLVPVPHSVPQPANDQGDQAAKKPKARRYKGRRNPHLGVTICQPSGKQRRWRLRWTDPDTGETLHEYLTDGQARSEPTRRDAAIARWKAVEARKAELAGGAEKFRAGDMELTAAIDGYFAAQGMLKASESIKAYRRGTNRFAAYCALPAVKVRKCRDVSLGTLRAYRKWLIAQQQKDGNVNDTTNNSLKWLAAVLGELAADQLLPLTREQVKEGLLPLKSQARKKAFHRSAQLRAILAACAAHDELDYNGAFAGCMLPTVLFILLTGLRSGEALLIEWRDVTIDADGKACIHVREDVGKTGERWIYLAHSPLLAHLVANRGNRSDRARILGGSEDTLDEARKRIAEMEGGVAFDCHSLRRTCGTFLFCAPSIFGAAAPYLTAAQLGHTIQTAQKSYVGLVQVDAAHRTTEAAMELGVNLADIPQL